MILNSLVDIIIVMILLYNHGVDSSLILIFLKRFFEKINPGGRVVSAANWQTWVPEFDSSRSQNFFRSNQESRSVH